MTRLEKGEQAPDFTVQTTQGIRSLSELREGAEKGVIVYFYPRAMTPGCTTEACDFRDNLNSLKSAGYTVVGISPDELPALRTFTAKQSLNFPLASDPGHEVLQQWGAWGQKNRYGRVFEGVIRSTVVVDPQGTVVQADYNVRAGGHVARLRQELGVDA